MNDYLGLEIDDDLITEIISKQIKKFNLLMTKEEFKIELMELYRIYYSELSEYDEKIITKFCYKLQEKYNYYLEYFYNDSTILVDNITVGSIMKWINNIE